VNFDQYTKPNGPWSKIDGWNSQGVFRALKLINDEQIEAGTNGHVCEIGVHEGQLFNALALLTRPRSKTFRELSIAIDVFDNQELNVDHSGGSTLQAFKKHLKAILTGANGAYHRNVLTIKADSLSLSAEDIGAKVAAHLKQPVQDKTANECIRLFSIDGGHTVVHALNDLKLAEQTLVAGGVVVVDDFMHPGWPGVTEAAHIYCSDKRSKLLPFAYGNNKLYLSHPSCIARMLELFKTTKAPTKQRREVIMWNEAMIWIDFE